MPRHPRPAALIEHLQTTGMSTRQVAREAGLSQSYVVLLRHGDRGLVRPSYATVCALLGRVDRHCEGELKSGGLAHGGLARLQQTGGRGGYPPSAKAASGAAGATGLQVGHG